MKEETDELSEAVGESEERIREEYGDLLFAVVNLGRFLGTDPETSLTAASNKFINRFEKMEELARKDGKDFAALTPDEQNELWNQAKSS